MNKFNADIELIRKYFNGELSPVAQHELEKRALDDPFLQDAMDGFEQFSNLQKDFNALNNRLADRIKKKEKVVAIWGFKQWTIAASLIFGIAAISIYFNQTPENKTIAVSELQKKDRLPKSVKILEDTLAKVDENAIANLIGNSASIAQKDVLTPAQAKEFSPADEITLEPINQMNAAAFTDTVGLNEIIVVGYGTQKKMVNTSSVGRFKAEESAKLDNKSALALRTVQSDILKNKSQNITQIIGKVTSTEDGLALPGVQITNIKNGAVVISNLNGEFKIAAKEKDQLTANYSGFFTETISVNKNDSLKIALQPDQKTLSEIAVTSYGNQKKYTEIFAGPKGGWKKFRKYLDDNATLINNERGKVVVQFIIQPDGRLSNFLIQKSYNTSANNKALQLIKDYGIWYGSADGKVQKAKVTVRFY